MLEPQKMPHRSPPGEHVSFLAPSPNSSPPMSRIVLAMSGGVDSCCRGPLAAANRDTMWSASSCGMAKSRQEACAVRGQHRLHAADFSSSGPITSKVAAARAMRKMPAAWPIGSTFRFTRSTCRPSSGRSSITSSTNTRAAARRTRACMCNNWIKFGKLFDYADSVGAEFVATGHYARLMQSMRSADRPPLLLAASMTARISRTCCSASSASTCRGCCFRSADFTKPEIRRLAAADRPARGGQEGQPGNLLCHVRQARRIRPQPRGRTVDTSGEIVTTDGRVVGDASGHRAVHHRPAKGAEGRDGRALFRRAH